MNNGWTLRGYSVFRFVFGAYLLMHFVQLMPWAEEMFSNAGVLPDASASPLLAAFPNLFAYVDSPLIATMVLVAAVGLSAMLAFGRKDRVAAVLLWYLMACMFGRNPLISNPSLPYVGMLLLLHAAKPRDWAMPPALHRVAWALMSLGYSYSGYTKLISPSWQDGTAMRRVLDNPLARPGLVHDFTSALPDWLLQVSTWGALGLELLFAPLALLARARPWIWATMLALHLGLIVIIDFTDLSLGMVMLHLFTFDPRWFRRRPRKPRQTKAPPIMEVDPIPEQS
jgi:hypothetical protein